VVTAKILQDLAASTDKKKKEKRGEIKP